MVIRHAPYDAIPELTPMAAIRWYQTQPNFIASNFAATPPKIPSQTTKNPVSNQAFLNVSLLAFSLLARIVVPQPSAPIVNMLHTWTAGKGM